ncbi:MAG: hypothetical protein U0324_24085 [Polyangiales bacterium]
MRALARVTALAALCGACAPEPEAPTPPLFDVVPVAAARGRPGAVVVTFGAPDYTLTEFGGARDRQPPVADDWRLEIERMGVLVSNIRLGRVVSAAGGRRVVVTVASDPRARWVEFNTGETQTEPGVGARIDGAHPLTAFALREDAPASAWEGRYAVSFDVGVADWTSSVTSVPRGAEVGGGRLSGTHFFSYMARTDRAGRFPLNGGYLNLYAPARFVDCANPLDGDGAFGVSLRRNDSAPAQLTLHPDHLFWTALGVEGQRSHVGLLADVPLDTPGTIAGRFWLETVLERIDVTGLVGPGDLPLTLNGARPVRTLLDFVTESVRTAVHFNGDGRCTVLPRAAP